jgi:hypothetical protein
MNKTAKPVDKRTSATGAGNRQQVTRFSIRVYTYPASWKRLQTRKAAVARQYLDRKQPITPAQCRTLVIEQFKQIDNILEELT